MKRFSMILVVVVCAAMTYSQKARAQGRLALPVQECVVSSSGKDVDAPCHQTRDPLFLGEEGDGPASLTGDIESQLVEYFTGEPWARSGRRPELGLAMSGGGSKMAPFAMGVLKRFADQDWLQRTDLISSVSGGGYTAYFLYAQAWAIEAHPERMMEHWRRSDVESGKLHVPRIKDLFAHVRSENYGEHLSAVGLSREGVYGPDELRYGRMDLADAESCRNFPKDSTRHQLFVDCHQDVLSRRRGGISTNVDKPPYGAFVKGGVLTLGSLPVHHVANSLFDWKLPLSPTQYMYRKGIGRTYGTVPNERGRGSDWRLTEDFGFAQLRQLYEGDGCVGDPCVRLPWWVINTTNAVRSADQADLTRTVFEITPNSFGSGNYGYVQGASIDAIEPGFHPLYAAAASAAFFDSLSPGDQYGLSSRALFLGLHTINLRWGLEIPNYGVSGSQRAFHTLLPWPLYYAHRFARDRDSTHIRLADGGQSGDNLGIFSLLRRGTRKIVIADGAVDLDENGFSYLPEMCLVVKLLETRGLDIVFQGLPADATMDANQSLSKLCMRSGKGLRPEVRPSFSPYRWQRAVWEGEIRAIEGKVPSPTAALLLGTRLYYLKSAIDEEKMKLAQDEWAENSHVCNGGVGNNYARFGIPCSMVGYRVDSNLCGMAGSTESHSCDETVDNVTWPQTSTAATTADSSANRFEAYRDLGWYVAGHLACTLDTPFSDMESCRIATGNRSIAPGAVNSAD